MLTSSIKTLLKLSQTKWKMMNFCGIPVNFKSSVKQDTFSLKLHSILCGDKGKITKTGKTNQSSLKQKSHMIPEDMGFSFFYMRNDS